MTTFADRIKRNRKNAAIAAVAGLAVTAALAYVLTFMVIFVAVPMEAGARQIVFALVAMVGLVGYGAAWAARSLYIENVDTVVERMGPLQRRVLVASIQEEGPTKVKDVNAYFRELQVKERGGQA